MTMEETKVKKGTKEKRVDGFGIMENIPSFEEDEEEHKEFW